MNVTSLHFRGQAGRPLRFSHVPLPALGLAALTLLGPLARAQTHSHLQSVNADGTSAWTPSLPFTIRGVLLCDPDEMLDFTPSFVPWDGGANQFRMGGEWQITFQATDSEDRGGTTCWIGQNYGNQPWIHDGAMSYFNEAWHSHWLNCLW